MLTVQSLGPFLGVQDGRNRALDAAGILRILRYGYLSGFNRLRALSGSNVAMTLMDQDILYGPTGVTSATSTSLTKTGAGWVNDAYAGKRVRIVAGTGVGQVRTIISNTATVLSVAAWTTIPDGTSAFHIEEIPVACSSVCYVGQFKDRVLAIAHSTTTEQCFLYLLDSDFTGWYDAYDNFTTASEATPLGVVWDNITDAPVVTVAELLDVAYIAHSAACNPSALVFATRKLELVSSEWLLSNLEGLSNPCYFLGVAAFQGHLFGWGFDFGTDPAICYRPELVRHGAPDGGAIDGTGRGSFTVGHRVRSAREQIVNFTVAADVAYIGTPFSVWPLIGFGRDTWDKSEPVDDSFGITGPLAAVAVNGVLYYWSSRGPMRVAGRNRPDPLWDAIPNEVAAVIDGQKIVAAYDQNTDRVLFFHRAGAVTGNQLVCAWDARRDKFVGVDASIGFPVACAQLITPVIAPSASGAAGPDGPPTSPVTSEVFQGSAKAAWTNGDTSLETTTIVEYRTQAGPGAWVEAGVVGPGISELYITGLSPSTAYEWRVYHKRFGIDSAALGPVAGTQFTTNTTCRAPVTGSLSLTNVGPAFTNQGLVEWENSIEDGVSTEIYLDSFTTPTGWVLQSTAAAGVASAFVTVNSTDTYQVRIRHVKSGLTASGYEGPAATELEYGPAS